MPHLNKTPLGQQCGTPGKIDKVLSRSKINLVKHIEKPAEFMTWVFKRLRTRFGKKNLRRQKDLISVLILTVLSQNTNDLNRDRAFEKLRQKFPRWQDLLKARTAEIEKAIRVGGLSRQKAARIKGILAKIDAERGNLDLSFLCKMDMAEAKNYLLGFKGIGLKTASVLLLFGCGMPAFPVDTHIFRVAKRLGVVGQKADEKKAHQILGQAVVPQACHEMHLNLIELGKKICHPRKPQCPVCPLNPRCRYYAQTEKNGSAS
jgi:endonuclease III